jgi:hypothetical protein
MTVGVSEGLRIFVILSLNTASRCGFSRGDKGAFAVKRGPVLPDGYRGYKTIMMLPHAGDRVVLQ